MEKPIPTVAEPGNYCAFNGWQTWPRNVSRLQAAGTLWSMRAAARRNQGRLKRESVGKYTLVGLNTVVLTTR